MTDLTDMPASQRLHKAEELAEHESKHSFDLSHEVLVRANLFRLAEEDHLFQFVIHHTIFDGWSLTIFVTELTSFYTALCKQEEAVLPPLPIQYIDLAAWEANQLKEGFPEEHINYWKAQLGSNPPVLEMPLDKLRPDIQSFSPGTVSLETSPSLTQKLHALSRQEGVTLFVTMLSVFYVLLGRYTAQEDIIVGTPIARRVRTEAEKLIGVLINNLALRTDLSGGIHFRELLKRVRRTVLDAFTHQEIPFENLLTELRIERDPSRTPLFQVFFNLLDFRKGLKLEFPDLVVESPPPPEVGSLFDLTLYVQNWGDTLKLKLSYNADLFSHERMVEMGRQLEGLLTQITEFSRLFVGSILAGNHPSAADTSRSKDVSRRTKSDLATSYDQGMG